MGSNGIEPITQLRDVHAIQGSDGNWNSSSYMRGLFNGLELALAIMEDRSPFYKDVPDNGYLHEPNLNDFKKSLESLLNYHGWDSAIGMQDFLLADMLVHFLKGMQTAHGQCPQLNEVLLLREEKKYITQTAHGKQETLSLAKEEAHEESCCCKACWLESERRGRLINE